MPNLQYIGARYVPVVYDNPDDGSANWKSGVSYENLVIVTYLDDSYTSRKPVPSSVGNPVDNPEYWAKTGDFNAALTALQNQVNNIENTTIPALDTRLDILENRKFIFIGDSYGNMTGSWIDNVISMLGLSSSDYFVGYENGAGLFMENGGGHTFADILSIVASGITDKDSITDIIIGGGVNDYYQSSGYISDSSAFSRLRTALAPFKNAKCKLCLLGKDNHTDYGRYTRYLNAIWKYKNLASAYGGGNVSFMHNSQFIMSVIGDFESDGIHPTAAGSVRIAYGIVAGILGSDAQYFNQGSLNVTAAVTNDGFGQVGNGLFVMDGNQLELVIPEFALNVYNANAITFAKSDNGTKLHICNFTGGAANLLHDRSGLVRFPANAFFAIQGESGWQQKNISVEIDGSEMNIFNDSGEQFVFERMRFLPINISLDRTNY